MTSDRKKRSLLGVTVLVALIAAGWVLINYHAPAADQPAERWLPVKPDPLVHQIGLVGRIEPEKTVTLIAPFEGNVLVNRVEQGQRVEAGQVLVQVDPGLVEVQVRDALSNQLKARRAVREMQDWQNGPLMARARRTLRSAELASASSDRKLQESQTLFKRGIIPRNELDDLEQQNRLQKLDLVAAQGELQQAQEQGRGEYRQIADMELANATVKYESLLSLLAGKDVLAPFSGIVVPAPGSTGAGAAANPTGPVQTGSRVSQGQVLFGLSSIEKLKIVAKVSELDINQLHQGQTVEVLGDGFDGERLQGSVDIVSGLALSNEASGSSAQFPVTLSIPKLTHEQMQRVRLGMSARLTIITYRNDQAIVVPSAAIQRGADSLSVTYRPALNQPVEQLTVTTGKSTPEGVEVFGLKEGFVRVQ